MKKEINFAIGNLIVFILLLLCFSFYAITTGHYTWLYDFCAGIILILIVYKLRKKLYLTNLLFFLFSTSLMLHFIGVFGAYTWSFLGFEYDTLPHLVIPFIITIIIFNYLKIKYNFSTKASVIFTILIILGIGTYHEIGEYLCYRFLGQGEGMFFFGPGDFGNSSSYDNVMTDLINNLIGGFIACILLIIKEKNKNRSGD